MTCKLDPGEVAPNNHELKQRCSLGSTARTIREFQHLDGPILKRDCAGERFQLKGVFSKPRQIDHASAAAERNDKVVVFDLERVRVDRRVVENLSSDGVDRLDL